ncbi:MAG: BolA family transcriptional regulator [Candidatus Marinimicrobia bacterium]|nr:BolA family transcriptional regulator [Candidatus Neomarinimicrobiota bacterium]|tara:strand:+ start:6522 stop:6764 length:243 start_codon:yes stop_codon:yes gene_type:complete
MTIEDIKLKLEEAFPGATIELINTSSMHIGHGAKGYHLKTTIEYSGFKGLSLIEQHRLVQKALKDELNGIIHALSIKTIV